MNTPPLLPQLLRLAWLGTLIFLRTAYAADPGTITGTITNSATRNTLEGAAVSIPALSLTSLSDNAGRYTLNSVPAGTHQLVVTYLGLDTMRETVVVTAGSSATRNFDLTSGIYKLDVFTVTGEREGNAAQITEKRNADNVKDVFAMDSFGYLPNMSAGEVVMRLPGVAGAPTDEGLNFMFNIRGTNPQLNNVTVDGASLPTNGLTRAFELQSITGAMFEAIELIKGQTPDKGADSLGGTINFKTRSTFSMKEDRRTTYNFSMRWAPPFLEQTPMRSQHRAHPILNLTHQQVFSVFGGERNLGTSLNVFYSENAVGGFEAIFDRTNLLNGPAPIWNYHTWDNYNNRKQQSVNLRTDYKWSNTTKFSLNITENQNFERHRRSVRLIAQTGGNTTVPNATTTGVVAGAFTDKVTVVRANTVAATPVPVTANIIDLQASGPLNYYVRAGRAELTGEHTFRNLNLEYTAGIARTTVNGGQTNGGVLNMRLFDPATQVPGRAVVFGGAGWIIDQTQDALHPKFTQNGGPDFTNPNNFLPRPTDGFAKNDIERDQLQKQFRFDARYQLPISAPIAFKTGFHWRSLQLDNWVLNAHRWVLKSTLAYDPAVRFPADPNYLSYDRAKTGRAIPYFWSEGTVTTDGRINRPELWTEDMYYNESQKFIGTSGATEAIGAQYAMLSGRLGRQGWRARTGFLGGIRLEDVHVRSWGWVRARRASPAAETAITAAPAVAIAAAQRDYANTDRVLYGKFDQKFPSLHTWHDITKDLKVRLSYSTSYGRAALNNFLPSLSVVDNATTQTITVNNPGIKPQQAKNWDATLEYYINQPAGSITFSWFHKDIRDFIVTNQFVGIVPAGTDNGYDGDYAGFSAYTSFNGGAVAVQGWEAAYNQQLTFVPGFLKGLSATFNYTWLNQHGVGSSVTPGGAPVLGRPPTPGNPAVYFTRRMIADFIPMTYNAGLRWNYGKYSAQALYNFIGEAVTSYNAANPALSQFRYSMKTLNVGVGYQHKPALGFTLDASNVLNEPQRFYSGYKDRTRRTIINFVTVAIGVNGRF
jgi:iron complex outermembrane receptor protein